MRKKVKRKTILIDGIRYYDDKPDTCRKCFFWKNRKVGCILGTQNCVRRRETTAEPSKSDTLTAEILHPFRRSDSWYFSVEIDFLVSLHAVWISP